MTLPPLPSPNMVHQSHGTTLLGYKEEKLMKWGNKCRDAALEEAAQCLLEAGYRSNGIPAYESLAERIRKMK